MFELTNPWLLLLLPVPLVLWFYLPAATLKLSSAMRVPFFNAMKELIHTEKRHMLKQPHFMLLFVIYSLLVLALTNPRWVGEPQAIHREGHHIMLVLDLSPSMAVNDMRIGNHRVTRLTAVKRAAEHFVKNRVNDSIGLILFGERAYLQTPLTHDRNNVLSRIEDATAGLAGRTTSIGDALGLAVKRLQNVPSKGRVIILLTDGANNSGVLSPIKGAELAHHDGIKVYTIGLGADVNPHSFNDLFLSMNAAAELDEDTLKRIAKITQARYFRATNLPSLEAVYEAINTMETISEEGVTVRPEHDYYPWPTALACMLFFYLLAHWAGFIKPRRTNR